MQERRKVITSNNICRMTRGSCYRLQDDNKIYLHYLLYLLALALDTYLWHNTPHIENIWSNFFIA